MKGTIIAVAVLVAATFGVARAGSNQAQAEALFKEGQKLMGEEKYAEACEKFEASQALAPSVSTLLNLGNCREKNNQLASAWSDYLEAQQQSRGNSKQKNLYDSAKTHAEKVESLVSYLTVLVPQESNIEGLQLTKNGEALDPSLWNQALAVDGGTYVITGKAPGHEEWSTTVTVKNQSDKQSVQVPKFKEVVPDQSDTGKDKDGGKDKDIGDDHKEPPPLVIDHAAPSSFTGTRKAAVGIGAVGLLGVGAGIVLGLQAKDFQDKADKLCPPAQDNCANATQANADLKSGQQRALFSDIGFGVGAAAIVTAGILWFVGAPHAESSATAFAPVVTPTSVAVSYAVRF